MAAPQAPVGRSVLLALSLCEQPVSVDTLVEWRFARPSELWPAIETARRRCLLFAEPAAGPGHFSWKAETERAALWREASLADWSAALVHPGLVALAIDHAHRAIEQRDRELAMSLYRALVQVRPPDLFPDGEIGFVRIVLECCERFAHADWRTGEPIDRALELARKLGDRQAETALKVARALTHYYEGDLSRAIALVEEALADVRTLQCGRLRSRASLMASLALILSGRIRKGLEVFEEHLGDVPQEVLPALDQLFGDDRLVAVECLGGLGLAYGVVGQPTRAIDLLHRAEAAGRRNGQEDVVQLARLYLIHVYTSHGNFGPGRQWARSVLEFFLQEPGGSYFAWFAAVFLAALHREDGDAEAARVALAIGHAARERSGFRYTFGPALFQGLEWLDRLGMPPVEGLDLEVELDRALRWPDRRMQGVAHHYVARRRMTADRNEEIADRLAESERLLRASGAKLDLAATLETHAAWSERRGELETAVKLRREAHELRRSVPRLEPIERLAEAPPDELALRIIELGLLFPTEGRVGTWGEIAAILCAHLGAERAAIVEAGPVRLLGARGGSHEWAEVVAARIAGCRRDEPEFLKPARTTDDPDEDGQLLVVPFECRNVGRAGWVALENRKVRPLLNSRDRSLLGSLSVQLSILLENASLLGELHTYRTRLEGESRYYRDHRDDRGAESGILGRSPALLRTLELVERVASTNSTVLITGETGVGKELLARELHRVGSRSAGPFIPVHVGSLAPGLVVACLFGHERGAFTGATEQVPGRFELADGGTLFLDEVGELGLEEQVRLLRVLQEGTFERVGGTRQLRSNFRLVAATNRDLHGQVKAGAFREDLFYRLNVFPLQVPPLRDRAEDIPLLALAFMEEAGRRRGRAFEGITEGDMARLLAYPWPGNVRELKHLVERAAILSDGARLEIPPLAPADGPAAATALPDERGWVSLAEAERRYIRRVLQHVEGRLTGPGGAAEILGLKPSTLHFRLDKLGLRSDLERTRRKSQPAGR